MVAGISFDLFIGTSVSCLFPGLRTNTLGVTGEKDKYMTYPSQEGDAFSSIFPLLRTPGLLSL